MTDKLDDLIRDALKGEDRDILEQTQELGWFELGFSQFKGKLGWVTWVIVAVQTAMFLGGIWCAIEFFRATDVLIALRWGLPALGLLLMAINLKLSLMPQMQAGRILREMRRIELMLAVRK